MAHRTLRLTDEDERNIARIQDHFRQSTIPVEVHYEAPKMINGHNATLYRNSNITARSSRCYTLGSPCRDQPRWRIEPYD